MKKIFDAGIDSKMLVRDLIKLLEEFNPDIPVIIRSTDKIEETACPDAVEEIYYPDDPDFFGDSYYLTEEEVLKDYNSAVKFVLIRPLFFGE